MVCEVEAVPLPPGPANPHANGFRMVETELDRVGVAQRTHHFNTARHWWAGLGLGQGLLCVGQGENGVEGGRDTEGGQLPSGRCVTCVAAGGPLLRC